MKQVGELIQESIEELENGASERAFATTCAAVKLTLQKSLETEALSGGDYQFFVKQHWRLLAFTGLPRALPMAREIDSQLKMVIHGFNISGAEEVVLHLIRQTAVMNRTPVQFKFHSSNAFEFRGDQIYVPNSLIGGLISIVILQPVNKGESVPDNFWINISDFKMFVSEFWGRIDLAERIMDL